MAFLLWTWACNQLKPTTGQQLTLKKHITSMSCPFELWYSQVTLVNRCPFWQLSIDHNMDVHNDVHYQVKHRWYMPWTSSLSNTRSLQENNAWSFQENSQCNQIAHTIVAICACIINCNNNTLENFFFLLMALLNVMMAIFLLWLCRPSQGHGSTEESRRFSGHCRYRKMQGTCSTGLWVWVLTKMVYFLIQNNLLGCY